MHAFNGSYEAGGHRVYFTAVRHDGADKWGITCKTSRGQSLMRETLGTSPWSLLGEMVDTMLDTSRLGIVNIAKPAQQQEKISEQTQPPRKPRGRPRTVTVVHPPASPIELGRPLDAGSDRPVV